MTREEATATLKEIRNTFDEIHENTNWDIGYEQMTAIDMAIEALQMGDVVTIQTGQTYGKSAYIKELAEVCRCKDCKHRYMDGDVTHYYWCRLHDRPVDDTDYCSWGEESEVEE